ncbi:tRNA (5-methylaminomethyl-2-thiouridine)(34)-methyltransferase MnmD [Faecalibacter rhinopitheci]|uniref:tRNA (5-methylaminomethyl-2-thiouridine)(34)-methyltransferase MnmD n=1 Tax=Faecalibacter rhinopitheci TaxID=2779678 RepID=A0A8J7FSE0_9FLAO|nr:tRNA (5-methylaminomethyl-2-thiouridine)(34)-methyltransferase MnmD [Faecalibacter rhinopitheci]MBF0598065.1 tRNA (5-methylaminomethyl-2-thiouridine)(34)-methyltransferase MnmD [Faecalibacter rhinopitheci]
MKRKIVETEDGSKTIHIEDWNETYHSIHGAVQEARHVFVKNGLDHFKKINEPINILEIGLGTGLNSFITFLEAFTHNITVNYIGVEKFPVSPEEFEAINFFDDVFKFYPELKSRKDELYGIYQKMFNCEWETTHEISLNFHFKKLQKDFFDLKGATKEKFDLVYFDAFGSQVQPELWEEELLTIVAELMKEVSILTTYAAKGSLKRAMKNNGFKVEKREGPPGKREMMVCLKNFNNE